MTPRRRYRRTGGRGIDVLLIVVLAAFCAFTWIVWLAAHVAVLGITAAALACAFWVGCRYERRTGQKPAPPTRRRSAERAQDPAQSARPLPQVPDPADQVALLEKLAGRPMDAIIASYQLIQQKYGGPR